MATSARRKTISTREFLAAFLANQLKTGTEDGVRRYKQILGDFEVYLGSRADLPLADMSVFDVIGFRDFELRRGASIHTARMSVRILRVPFSEARRHNLISTNPAERLVGLGAKAPPRAFTVVELQAVLSESSADWHGMILLGYWCGYSAHDAVNLRWSDIDLERGVIRLCPARAVRVHKTHTVETVILPELRAWLVQRQANGDTWLFPLQTGNYRRKAFGITGPFDALMRDAHLEYLDALPTGTQCNLGYQSLPHSHVMHAVAAGVPEEICRTQLSFVWNVPRAYTRREIKRVQQAYANMPWLSPAHLRQMPVMIPARPHRHQLPSAK